MRIRITDEHVMQLYSLLERNQVVVVSSPTGTGKSIYLLYRLLDQAPGCPTDFVGRLIRQGQIIQTQPLRTTVARNPEAVATRLLGESEPGPLMTLGLYHRGLRKQSRHNLGQVVTDGAVRNWIREGQLGQYSVLFVDEAHKRSLNIDILLAMLRWKLPQYPHLRVIISSATIDPGEFTEAFEEEGLSVGVLDLSKTLAEEINYSVHYWGTGPVKGCDCWLCKSTDIRTALWKPWDQSPRLADLPAAVSAVVVEILTRTPRGSVLAFLPGESQISQAKRLIEERLGQMDMQTKIAVIPLYRRLGDKVEEGLRSEADRRVFLSTDVTETGITIPDLAYGIDSGYIKEAQWDRETLTRPLETVPHSRAGRLQRWGRFGRTQRGYVYCLYREEDFHAAREQTSPEALRSPLDDMLLTLKAAGVPEFHVVGKHGKEEREELERERQRSLQSLRREGLLDENDCVTERGMEVFGEVSAADIALLALADEQNCLIEAATALALMASDEGEIRTGEGLYDRFNGLLIWDTTWDAPTKDRVWRIQQALKTGCEDDLDFTLKLAWLYMRAKKMGIGAEWARWHFVNAASIDQAISQRDALLKSAYFLRMEGRSPRELDLRLIARVRSAINAVFSAKLVHLNGKVPICYEPSTGAAQTPCVISRHCAGDWAGVRKAVLLSATKAMVTIGGRPTLAAVGSFLVRVGSCAERYRDELLVDQCLPVGSLVAVGSVRGEPHVTSLRDVPGPYVPTHRVSVEPAEDDAVETGSDKRMFLREFLPATEKPLQPQALFTGGGPEELGEVMGWDYKGRAPVAVLRGTSSSHGSFAQLQAGDTVKVTVRRVFRDPVGRGGWVEAVADGGPSVAIETADMSLLPWGPGLESIEGSAITTFMLEVREGGTPRLGRINLVLDDLKQLHNSNRRTAEGQGRRAEPFAEINGFVADLDLERKMLVLAAPREAGLVHGFEVPEAAIPGKDLRSLSVGKQVRIRLRERIGSYHIQTAKLRQQELQNLPSGWKREGAVVSVPFCIDLEGLRAWQARPETVEHVVRQSWRYAFQAEMLPPRELFERVKQGDLVQGVITYIGYEPDGKTPKSVQVALECGLSGFAFFNDLGVARVAQGDRITVFVQWVDAESGRIKLVGEKQKDEAARKHAEWVEGMRGAIERRKQAIAKIQAGIARNEKNLTSAGLAERTGRLRAIQEGHAKIREMELQIGDMETKIASAASGHAGYRRRSKG
jgi:HrpA-like RNA helicase